jgi:pimeloyl-ACP methyl ester carboxylesterase
MARKQPEHHGRGFSYGIDGAGPPVLLIQWAGLHGGGWKPQVDALAHDYTCLTFDDRGMCANQPLGAPLTVAQMAGDAPL